MTAGHICELAWIDPTQSIVWSLSKLSYAPIKKYLHSKSGRSTNSLCEVLKCNKIHTTFGTKTLRNMIGNGQQNITI